MPAMTYTSMSPMATLATIPQDAGGHAGTGTSKLADGPTAGTQHMFVLVTPLDDTTAANLIRIFVKAASGGPKVPWGTYPFCKRLKNADDPNWQKPLKIGPVPVQAGEELHISQEQNDGSTKLQAAAMKFNVG